MLACSSSSLRTISGTNIFSTVPDDEAELYLPWDIIIHLILRGEQSQKNILVHNFSPVTPRLMIPLQGEFC